MCGGGVRLWWCGFAIRIGWGPERQVCVFEDGRKRPGSQPPRNPELGTRYTKHETRIANPKPRSSIIKKQRAGGTGAPSRRIRGRSQMTRPPLPGPTCSAKRFNQTDGWPNVTGFVPGSKQKPSDQAGFVPGAAWVREAGTGVSKSTYRGTAFIRNTLLVGSCGSTMRRALWWS